MMNSAVNETRGVPNLLNEIKEEAKQFVRTRVDLLRSELQTKLPALKTATMLSVVGILFLATAYFLVTGALVALIVGMLQNNDYRWVFAFLAVAILWSALAALAFYFAKREFQLKGVMPRRTIEVLKGDKIWIEKEARNQI
jgi:uncharacterized membrane protein YqjE